MPEVQGARGVSGKKFQTEKHRRLMKKQRENRKRRLPKIAEATPAEVETTPAEVETMIAEAKKASTQVICPLCNLPITVDEAVHKNVDSIIYNQKPVQVHKTCPTEGKE